MKNSRFTTEKQIWVKLIERIVVQFIKMPFNTTLSSSIRAKIVKKSMQMKNVQTESDVMWVCVDGYGMSYHSSSGSNVIQFKVIEDFWYSIKFLIKILAKMHLCNCRFVCVCGYENSRIRPQASEEPHKIYSCRQNKNQTNTNRLAVRHNASKVWHWCYGKYCDVLSCQHSILFVVKIQTTAPTAPMFGWKTYANT